MIPAARIIPVDGRPHLPPSMRMTDGDSIGRWQGNTLVVDTTSVDGRGWIAITLCRPHSGRPQTEAFHAIERFTMLDAHCN
jgi:hypothetical protein